MSSTASLSAAPASLIPQDDDFVFLSPHKSLLARGKRAVLTQPAAAGHHNASDFQQQVRQLFQQAQRDGVENPVIAGAIPFDKQQPCTLFVPESCHWFERQEMNLNTAPQRVEGQLQCLPEHNAFCSMVSQALTELQTDSLDKVVLSRLLRINSCNQLCALRLWQQLSRQNPISYNFHLPLAEGVLIGASPELLLRKVGNDIYSCPLAGSARRGEDTASDTAARDSLLASQKDHHEHQVVTKAIKRRLAEHCQQLTIPQPSLLSTPTLWHLATEIHGQISNPQENALSLACLLHPTPALCGTPYPVASKLISALEPFNRGWFGGIVGWCDAQGNGEWVVVIRSGKILPHQIELFAGAGIVSASCPESEWQETGTKFNTMLRALGIVAPQELR